MVFHGRIIGVPIMGQDEPAAVRDRPASRSPTSLGSQVLSSLGTMSPTRTEINVSTHLIELNRACIAPASPSRRSHRSTGPHSSATIVRSSWRSAPARDCSSSTPRRARQGRNFLGVEISKKYARLAALRLARHGIGQRRRSGPATSDRSSPSACPIASLEAVHVYFPDPWWKKRHKKRRVFNEDLVAQIAPRPCGLAGALHVASDVEEYFGLIRELIAVAPGFRERPAPETVEAPSTTSTT